MTSQETYNELVEKFNAQIPEGDVKVILSDKEVIAIAENLLPIKNHTLTKIDFELGRFVLRLKAK